MNKALVALATKNVGDMVRDALEYRTDERALVVYDTRHELTRILTEAYRKVLPDARFIDFDTVSKDDVIKAFDAMSPRDLVVLIQSTNFLLDAFRIRLHLFKKKLKVIEHTHLHRNSEAVWDVYVNAIAYDKSWYRTIGPALKSAIEQGKVLTIESAGDTLTVEGGLENPKLNIGDYAGMENIGGTFPIGEVFTEAKDFGGMNGAIKIYAFAGNDFTVQMHEPFRVTVKNGDIVACGPDAPEAFRNILDEVRENERPLIREIGFGLNRAITRERYLEDITAFERILGLHISLGEKHSVYKKEGITTHKARYHVDLFPFVTRVLVDGKTIFENGKYCVI